MNTMQTALIRKDIHSITSNKRLFPVLVIVPLIMTVLIPSIFLLTIVLSPVGVDDFQSMVALLPESMQQGDIKKMVISLMLNNIIPLFFLLIPIMAASVMAASSFVGEKEKQTLETLLYCPMTLRQIFQAKILASFLLSMSVSLLSFLVMTIVVELELWFLMGTLILPSINWLIMIVLVSPGASMIAITLIVQGSAKAQTIEESQQRSVFLILPVFLLVVGQFSGLLLINVWILLGLGVILAALALLLLKRSFRGFHYELLLK